MCSNGLAKYLICALAYDSFGFGCFYSLILCPLQYYPRSEVPLAFLDFFIVCNGMDFCLTSILNQSCQGAHLGVKKHKKAPCFILVFLKLFRRAAHAWGGIKARKVSKRLKPETLKKHIFLVDLTEIFLAFNPNSKHLSWT